LCLYLVQKYEKNAVANDKCVFATCTEFNLLIYTNANSDKDIIICDSLYSCDFCLFNTITNCNGNILDLYSSNCDYIKIENCIEFTKTNVFHPPFMFEISVDNVFVEDLCDIFYDYSNADYDEINTLLSNVNWNTIDSCRDINEAVSLFYYYLRFVCGLFLPVKRKCKSTFPPWFDPDVRRLIRRKSTLHRRYKISHNANDYVVFAAVRTQCKEALKKSYKEYIKRNENFITSDPENFWKYINEHTKCNEIPNLMIYHNNLYVVMTILLIPLPNIFLLFIMMPSPHSLLLLVTILSV
jgi:hypothetical protein